MQKTFLVPLVFIFQFFGQVSAQDLSEVQDYQEWFGGNFMLTDLIDAPRGYCLDLEGYAATTDTSAPVIVHSCKEGYWKDGTWRVNYPEVGQIYLPEYGLCMAAAALEHDAVVVLEECTDAPLQHFVFQDNGQVEVQSDLSEKFCLAVGETSRPTGANLRRQTRIANCETTEEQYTHWILPAEDAVYTDFSTYVAETVSAATPRGAGGAAPGGMGAPAGGGPPGGNLFTGACAACHAPTGNGLASEFAPKLTGQEDWYLTRQMNNFAQGLRGGNEGERWATQMMHHAETFGAPQIASFVSHIQSLEDVPAPATVEGDILRGEDLYLSTCAACHGFDGMGNAALNSPRLAGMSDWYTQIQLNKFRVDMRGNHPEDLLGMQMAIFAKALPDAQAVLDVTAYINTLAPE